MKLKITNRSGWPTPALKVLCEWIARREKITWPYEFLFRDTAYKTFWAGRGRRDRQTVTMHRRLEKTWPYTVRDSRFKVSFPREYRSRLEALVALLAHEAHHATDGQRLEYRDQRTGRADVEGMEMACHRAGMEAVRALRVEWPKLRARIRAALKKERTPTVPKPKPGAPEKLEAARERLAVWERKAKLAKTKIKKYAARVRRYERALDLPR